MRPNTENRREVIRTKIIFGPHNSRPAGDYRTSPDSMQMPPRVPEQRVQSRKRIPITPRLRLSSRNRRTVWHRRNTERTSCGKGSDAANSRRRNSSVDKTVGRIAREKFRKPDMHHVSHRRAENQPHNTFGRPIDFRQTNSQVHRGAKGDNSRGHQPERASLIWYN